MFIDYINGPTYATVLAIASIAAGLALAVGGYYFRRVGIVTCAVLTTGNLVVAIVFDPDVRDLHEPTWYYVTYFATGVICGGVALLYTKIGFGITGFGAGFVLAQLILSMTNYYGTHTLSDLAIFIAVGVIAAALTLRLEKPAFIVATSFVGMHAFALNGALYFTSRTITNMYGVTALTKDIRRLQTGIATTDNLNKQLESAWWQSVVLTCVYTFIAAAIQKSLADCNTNRARSWSWLLISLACVAVQLLQMWYL